MKTSDMAPSLIGSTVEVQWPNGDRVSGVLQAFDARAEFVHTAGGAVASRVLDIHAKVGQFEIELSGIEAFKVLE